jgi:hypothetical protein
MIKVSNIDVFNFEGAIRGMRNPLNSWDKSDSYYGCGSGNCKPCTEDCYYRDRTYVIGENDLDLMKRLYKGGSEHRKYLRQIMLTIDITAPLYWWKEFDTYKVGTVANSCSTMHKIHDKEFTLDDFSHDKLNRKGLKQLELTIIVLNDFRKVFLMTNNKEYWWQMIQLLPSSYNQRRTVTLNYENVMTMINQRSNHKLNEWRDFVRVLKCLPYVLDIRGE